MQHRKTANNWLTFVLAMLVNFYPLLAWGQGALENPAPNSHQSGIGVISGWYCTANTIDALIDGKILLPVAYGTIRGDTQATCGDTNNGFGVLVNWADLPNGQHTVQVRADGSLFATATVTVTTLGTSFLQGASSTTTATINNQQVTLQWQESSQNFVIVGVAGGGSPSQNFSGQWFFDGTQGSNTCVFATPDKVPLHISTSLGVTQNGTDLTVMSGSASLQGNVDSTGKFTVVGPPSTDSSSGCTFSLAAGYTGNFVTGQAGFIILADRVSGNCVNIVPCQVVWTGSITKTSALSTEQEAGVEELLRKIQEAARGLLVR